MDYLRLARISRWYGTLFALAIIATALAGGFDAPPGEPRWQRALFPLGVALLAVAHWVSPVDFSKPVPRARTRAFWAVLAFAIAVLLLRIYQLAARSAG